MNPDRVRVFGGDALRACVAALAMEPVDGDAAIAVIEVADRSALAGASACAPDLPRVFVASGEDRALLAALGVPDERIAAEIAPAVLGPVVVRAMPRPARGATRVVAVTGARGGVGRTLLATNLARCLATRLRVAVIDATGSGAVAWWFGVDAHPWSDLTTLGDELSADHLMVIASEPVPGVHVIGGRGVTPTVATLEHTMRAASHLDDLVLVDLPPLFDERTRAAHERADRVMVLAYDDPLSLASLEGSSLDDAWVIASQTRTSRLGACDVFRSLPRDEGAVREAFASRSKVAGALGHAYEDLAALLALDAS